MRSSDAHSPLEGCLPKTTALGPGSLAHPLTCPSCSLVLMPGEWGAQDPVMPLGAAASVGSSSGNGNEAMPSHKADWGPTPQAGHPWAPHFSPSQPSGHISPNSPSLASSLGPGLLCASGSLPDRGPHHCVPGACGPGQTAQSRGSLTPMPTLCTCVWPSHSTGRHRPSPGLSPATSVVFCSQSTLCSSALLGSEAGAWLPPLARVVRRGCSFVSQANIFLRVLDISYNGCGDSGASAVGEALKTNNVLEELYMR